MVILKDGFVVFDFQVDYFGYLLNVVGQVYYVVIEFCFEFFIQVGFEFLGQVFQLFFQGCFFVENGYN